MGSHTAFLVVVLAIVGLALGSFANVVIYRVPRGESVVHPPSRCPTCGTQLSSAENVPIFSWLVLRGRCRHCHTPISPRYPLVEAATAGVFAVTAGVVGTSWQVLPLVLLGAAVIVVVGIDADGFVTPAPVLAALGVAVVLNAVVALASGDDAAVVRAVTAGMVCAAVGALGARGTAGASSSGAESASARRWSVAGAVVAGTLGWFAGWASSTAGVIVVAVFAVVAVDTRGSREHAGNPAGRRSRVPLWLPVVLAYGAVLGGAAAR